MPRKNGRARREVIENDCEDRLKEVLPPDGEGLPPKAQIDAAQKVASKVRGFFLRQPGVTAVDVGFKVAESEDRFTPDIAVRVHVKEKLPEDVLRSRGWKSFSAVPRSAGEAPRDRGPETQRAQENLARIPMKIAGFEVTEAQDGTGLFIGGVPLDVIEARYFPSMEVQVDRPVANEILDDLDRSKLARRRVAPLVGGISISRNGGPAGTLGAIVWDRTDGSACLLSNWHILAGSIQAGIGQPCFQPAISDGGTSDQDAVATLKRWLFNREGDAALAEIASDRYYCPGEILGLNYPVLDCVEPYLGMKVRKWGRSSGFTRGFIDGIDLAINIDYGAAGVRQFEKQLHIAPRCRGGELSSSGDSGAVWVHNSLTKLPNGQTIKRYYAVALHFAGNLPGSPFGEHAIASRIKELAEELEFSFRPVFVPPGGFVVQPRHLTGPIRALEPVAAGVSITQPSGQTSGEQATGPQPETEPFSGGG